MSLQRSRPPGRRSTERGKGMASGLNLLIAGIVGFIVGLALEWLLEIWYFRRWRKTVRDERTEQLQAAVSAKENRIRDLDGRLERAQVRMNALQGEVAQRAQELERIQAERLARLAAVVSDTETPAAPAVELPTVDFGAVELPTVEAPAVELPTLDAPAVELPTLDAPAVELPKLGVSAVELPTVDFGAVELPTLDAPAVELPTLDAPAVELPKLGVPAVEMPKVHLGAVALPTRGMEAMDVVATGGGVTNDSNAAASLIETATGDDPLIEINGIGPRYDQRLRAAGVTTFASLAAMTVDELAAIIRAPSWRKTDYTDWIRQAQVALEHGVEAIAQQPAMRSLQPDNLTLLAEVGEKTADALRAAGFYSFASLAAASPQDLAAVVESAGLPGGDYAAWIQEAAERTTGSSGRRSVKPS